jgi:hypothetical protein
MEMSEEERTMRAEVAREVFDGEMPEEVEEVAEEVVAEDEPKEEDPWAGVNPTLRQTLESIQARIGDLDVINGRLKQAESRIGGLNNQFHEVKQKVVSQPTPEQVQKAAESDQAWKDLEEDFPEYAKALANVRNELTEKTAELGGRIPDPEKFKAQMDEEVEARIETIRRQMETKLVKMAHKDLDQIKVSPDFKAFVQALPPDKQSKLNSWNSEDAIEILDLYKSERDSKKNPAAIVADRAKRLESAAADNRTSRKPAKTKSMDDMTEEELRRYIFSQEFKE